MITGEEFIDALGDEINSLFNKLDAECKENEYKKDLYSEYRELLQRFLNCIADSNYDIWECRGSFSALGTICNIRTQKLMDESSTDDSNVSSVESKDAAAKVISDCKRHITTITSISTLQAEIIKVAIKMQMLVVSNLDKSGKGGSNNSDENDKISENADEFYDDLGCSKHEMELLESLMGEFPEFDPYLRK